MILTEQEQHNIQKFIDKHTEKCGNVKIILNFSKQTGLGRTKKVKCDKCKKKKDVTDYAAW